MAARITYRLITIMGPGGVPEKPNAKRMNLRFAIKKRKRREYHGSH